MSSDLSEKKQQSMLAVPVLFLDDTTHTFHIEKRAKGAALLDQVFGHVELCEKDYFGLQFIQQPGDVIRWLDPNKPFRKQWPHKLPPVVPIAAAPAASTNATADPPPAPAPFQFRVKFYVSDPSRLQEEYTRYQFYLQIKRDIWSQRLACPLNTACLLASYTVQAELGDYSAQLHGGGTQYLSAMQLLRDQSAEMERRIGELHKLHRGQLPADAEYNYLEHAKKLYMYGVDIHQATVSRRAGRGRIASGGAGISGTSGWNCIGNSGVVSPSLSVLQDSSGKEISLGVTSLGLVVYQNSVRMNVFSWSKMVKISFKRKEFFIQLRREPSENYDTLLGFGMYSHKRAKALWKSCVEHHSFFRLERPNRLPRFLPLSLGSRFYYSGRTEVQAVQESRQRAPISKVFNRSPSKRMMAVEAAAAAGASTSAECSADSGDGVTVSKGADVLTNGGGGGGSSNGGFADNGTKVFRRGLDGLAKAYRPHSDGHNRVTSVMGPNSLPRKAWEQQSDDEGGFIVRCAKSYDAPSGPLSDALLANTNHHHATHPAAATSTSDQHLMQPYQHQNQRHQQQRSVTPIHLDRVAVDPDDPALVRIRLQADEHGRFGFNVRGGIDLKLPVLVSRVAPHTPADRTVPRICEGDQVVLINGQDVSGLQHEQVVALIRASRESADGELVLTVKPNALIDPSEEEPLYQYVPDSGLNGGAHNQLHGDALFTQSLLLLSDGLASGALLSQYEQMYRKNANLAITEARKADNVAKNRYRDISPYDCTRVVLINSDSGDYINANYVNMEIPADGINRYIATQGPLASTTVDFWRMVQQESSHLVVMLTTVMERGRAKCHQYWPAAGEELRLSDTFAVRCLSESPDETGSFVFRELLMLDRVTGEQRAIQHMQYLAWPDHGVPADPELFLQFTQRMRALRKTSLLQEIDMSLAKMRLMDDDDDDDDDVGATDDADDAASDDVENEKASDGEMSACANTAKTADSSGTPRPRRQRQRNARPRKARLAQPEALETETEEDAGQSPEEIDLPPSTSIHQFISAANPPIVVHCSAGIGRTGVLILMDTALALMDAKEPVYPLDVVQAMRDQRACMVQNVGQYRFVCECICVAYSKIARTESITSADEGDNTAAAPVPSDPTNESCAAYKHSADAADAQTVVVTEMMPGTNVDADGRRLETKKGSASDMK